MDVEISEVTRLEQAWPELIELFKELTEYHAPLTGQELLPDWEQRLRSALEPPLRSGHSLILLARRGGEPIGFLNAHVFENTSLFRERVGFIDNAYVRPEWRRKRVGSALIDRAEAWFREQRAGIAQLNVVAANALGKQVWDAKGYRPFAETRRKPLA